MWLDLGPVSQPFQSLNTELKRCIGKVIVSPDRESLESVQALLTIACYSTERNLFTSLASQMALDLQLPSAYEDLLGKMSGTESGYNYYERAETFSEVDAEDAMLFRKARIWFGLFILEHMSASLAQISLPCSLNVVLDSASTLGSFQEFGRKGICGGAECC
jgi:hypothetical protein